MRKCYTCKDDKPELQNAPAGMYYRCRGCGILSTPYHSLEMARYGWDRLNDPQHMPHTILYEHSTSSVNHRKVGKVPL